MAFNIVDWNNAISLAEKDEKVGIRIATLLESEGRGTYLTILPPGASVKPHYHQHGDEEYHIITGSGVIKLSPVNALNKEFQFVSKNVYEKNSFIIPPNVIHQLINNGSEDLTLIFSCPLSHLNEDRIVIENFEDKLNG